MPSRLRLALELAHAHAEEELRDRRALLGAREQEVVCMNSLTVNLHLLCASSQGWKKPRFWFGG